MNPFPCNRCGACCRHVNFAEATRDLDRGDGCCRHYDEASKLCRIYEQRPEICRVEQSYRNTYHAHMSWERYLELNQHACVELQKLP